VTKPKVQKNTKVDALTRLGQLVGDDEIAGFLTPWEEIRQELHKLNRRDLVALAYRIERLATLSYQEGYDKGSSCNQV
jgi:hypothetical protein